MNARGTTIGPRTRPLSPGVGLLRRLGWAEHLPGDDHPAWLEAAERILDVGRVGMRAYAVLLLLAILCGWPSDFFLLEDDEVVRRTFSFWRASTIGLMGLWWLADWRFAIVERYAVPAAAAYAGILTLWTAWVHGSVADFHTPWPYYLYIALVAPTPVPMWTRDRLMVVAAIVLGIVGGYLGLHPEHRLDPVVPDAMAFLSVVTILGIVTGEVVLAASVAFYFQHERLAGVTASLADLNRSLDDRLKEQTRDLRALARHLVHVQETERNRIAADLHDDLGQQLATVRFLLGATQRRWPEGAPGAEGLHEVQALLGTASESVRQLATSLRPLQVEQLGLTAACANLTATLGTAAGLAHEFSSSGRLDGLDDEVNVTIYRVLQEALTNVTRHARAAAVDVTLDRVDDEVVMVVQDDGRGPGLDERRAGNDGFGLVGMRERALSVGGDVTVGEARAGGTRVVLTIPLAAEAP